MSKFQRFFRAHLPVTVLLCALTVGCRQESQGPDGEVNHPAAQPTLHIQAAASTQDALNEVLALFSTQNETKLTVNYASSAALAQQISQGAPADLFLSASLEWVDRLEQEQHVAKRVNLLGNQLVVIVPTSSTAEFATLADLDATSIEHLALADPDSVPAGKYAKQALEKSDLWNKFSNRVVRGSDVRQALTFVEQGEAEAGIVYATDAAASSAVRVVYTIPGDLSEPIVYPLALLKSDTAAGDRTSAEKLFEFLTSESAAMVFAWHGFEILLKK